MGVLPHVTLVLSENNSIITESESVAKIFNKYFNEIAEGIGFNDPIPENLDKDDILLSMIKRYDDHPSIMAITRGQSFGIVNPDSEKSTGYDGIPAKLLKVGTELLSVLISKLTNMSIGECTFPDLLNSSLWRHHGRGSVSNHQPHDCLLNRLFRRRSKNIAKLRVTGLCAGNSPETGEFPAQMASNAENGSIWWRHHVPMLKWLLCLKHWTDCLKIIIDMWAF